MKILDTTVRDGSYAVDFKFSCKDVQDLVSKSDKLGIEYIEIGHGHGLNASSYKYGFALQTDVEYMDAAKKVALGSKLGFFCIPGIAKVKDIDIAKTHGMDFIRVGVTVQEYEKAKPYIEKCLSLDLEVFVNFMKSYSATPRELGNAAADLYNKGVMCVYIVDSAGNMCAQDIGEYIAAIREHSTIAIGFHGHNNLGLAVDNTLYCVKKGIDFIDCTFQGIGRSLGNASLEQVVMNMEKRGYNTGFDIPRVLEYGYSGLRNIVNERLVNPLDYMCGYAGFHSSFLKEIYRCCIEKEVDPLRLIMAYSKENVITMDYDRLCQVAEQLPRDTEDNPYGFGDYFSVKYSE